MPSAPRIDRAPNSPLKSAPSLATADSSCGGRPSVRVRSGIRIARRSRNPTIWPTDETQAQPIAAKSFQLEKAFYEIEYELTNRPTWTHIPLEGTLRILQQRGVVP